MVNAPIQLSVILVYLGSYTVKLLRDFGPYRKYFFWLSKQMDLTALVHAPWTSEQTFARMDLTLGLWEHNIPWAETSQGEGGTCQNFDRDARPIFWVWNLAKSYFSELANFLAIFPGFAKFPLFFWVWQISSYFLGLPIFVSHTWILWMINTQYWKTKS